MKAAVWVHTTMRWERIAIRQHAADGAERKNRNLRGKTHETEQSRGPGKPIDQLALRYLLHPGPAHGAQPAGKIQFVVTMAQRAPQRRGPKLCSHFKEGH